MGIIQQVWKSAPKAYFHGAFAIFVTLSHCNSAGLCKPIPKIWYPYGGNPIVSCQSMCCRELCRCLGSISVYLTSVWKDLNERLILKLSIFLTRGIPCCCDNVHSMQEGGWIHTLLSLSVQLRWCSSMRCFKSHNSQALIRHNTSKHLHTNITVFASDNTNHSTIILI